MKKTFLLMVFLNLPLYSADYSLIQHLVGTYPLLEYNGEPRIAGTLKVLAGDQGLGVELIPTQQANLTVPPLKLLTPKEATELVKEGGVLTQNFHGNGESLRIQYIEQKGMLEIKTRQCSGTNCTGGHWTGTSGMAPGESIPPGDFFSRWVGLYVIESAGGTQPAPEYSRAKVKIEDQKVQATAILPYCIPNVGCDPGDQIFPFETTRVYVRQLVGSELAVILVRSPAGLSYFAWETLADGAISFRNYQYEEIKRIIFLEHVLRRS